MTAFLPLDAATSLPSSPRYLVPSPDPAAHVKRVIKALIGARSIAVVCGAGISVQAGIPDFRSSEGLFRSLGKGHSTIASGKDLFDASVFISEDTTSLFCQMVAQLWQLSERAEPTTFHRFLRFLDDSGRLLRVYTQNIDALEEKSGLTFGVPELDCEHTTPRSSKGRAPSDAYPGDIPSADMARPDNPSASQLASPLRRSSTNGTPKCIPLHGTLHVMHCVSCVQSYHLRDFVDSLVSGKPPPCPQCTALEETRRLVGKRPHRVGTLRPSIVLYNEVHENGEAVGSVFQKDLTGRSEGGTKADLLLVVGTSLRVPGTKHIVRKFSKAVRSLPFTMKAPPESERRGSGRGEDQPIRTIYLNFDFPAPTRQWEGVFDVWIQGDAQVFARMVNEELEKQDQVKDTEKGGKRKREEEGL